MKIHSKFRDYYDSVQSFGQDENVHFIRNTEQISIPAAIQSNIFKNVSFESFLVKTLEKSDYAFLVPFVIFFCGRIYRGVRYQSYNYHTRESVDLGKIFYNKEEAIKFFQENQDLKTSFYFSERKRSASEKLGKWLENQQTLELEEYAIENKLPIIAIGREAYKNPSLQYLEFFRVVDSYTAYQELDMYISGVLSKDSAMMVEISDKDRIPQHGFDKWSFRKLPTKHRK
jgi:hypothetical protein